MEPRIRRKGRLTAPAEDDFLDQVIAQGVDDLFCFSHGWSTSQEAAGELYDAMFPMIQHAATGAANLGKAGFAGLLWPSLWFPPTPATPPATAGAAQAGNGATVDLDAGTAALTGTQIATSLQQGFTDPAQQQTVQKIGELIDQAAAAAIDSDESDAQKEQRLRQIHQHLTSLVPPPPPDDEFEDSGETALLLTDDPTSGYLAAAEAFGTAPPGSATQGIGDWFGHAVNGAKDALRVLSYTIMKARAGDIGRAGLGPLLQTLHTRSPSLRVHLIGHSFGARLVSFALSGISTPRTARSPHCCSCKGPSPTGRSHTSRTTPSAAPAHCTLSRTGYTARWSPPSAPSTGRSACGTREPPSWPSRTHRPPPRDAGAAWAPTDTRR